MVNDDYIWVNYNDLTGLPTPGIMVRGIIPIAGRKIQVSEI